MTLGRRHSNRYAFSAFRSFEQAQVTGTLVISGVPHVVGVRTSSGDEIHADLVVDTMGRRSPAADWIAGIGGHRPYEEAEDSNFLYYTQYFRGPQRPRRVGRALTPMGAFSILTLDGDNDTWSVTVFPCLFAR